MALARRSALNCLGRRERGGISTRTRLAWEKKRDGRVSLREEAKLQLRSPNRGLSAVCALRVWQKRGGIRTPHRFNIPTHRRREVAHQSGFRWLALRPEKTPNKSWPGNASPWAEHDRSSQANPQRSSILFSSKYQDHQRSSHVTATPTAEPDQDLGD